MSNRFEIFTTALKGVYEIKRKRLEDDRGYLERLFCKADLLDAGWSGEIAQINLTKTKDVAVLRGLHFQIGEDAEIKIVTCLSGKVFDVAVDLRAGSPTFAQTTHCILDSEKGNALVIPKGFAHGFQTLTPNCEMLYLHSAFYNKENEAGVNALDAELGIEWPLPVSARSDRDAQLPALVNAKLPGVGV